MDTVKYFLGYFILQNSGIAKIVINRPHVRNEFRPLTIKEMQIALEDARLDSSIGVVILTGYGKNVSYSPSYLCSSQKVEETWFLCKQYTAIE